MVLSGQPTPPGSPRRPAAFARELLSVLVGVEYAEVGENDGGEVDQIRVWGTGEFQPPQLIRNITTALSAHLDLTVDPQRIHIMSGPPPSRDPVPKQALDAAIARVLHGEPRESESPPAAGDEPATGQAEGTTEPDGLPAAHVDPTDRILYEGYEVVSHRSREARLRVTLEWGDRQFIGQAHGTDAPRETAEALARATLRALEGIVHTRIRNSGFSLDLAGLQFTEAFGYRLVVAVVELKRGERTLPLSGSVVVRHGTGLAAILAVLQAADRRVRAILEEPEGEHPGPTQAPPSPPPPDAH